MKNKIFYLVFILTLSLQNVYAQKQSIRRDSCVFEITNFKARNSSILSNIKKIATKMGYFEYKGRSWVTSIPMRLKNPKSINSKTTEKFRTLFFEELKSRFNAKFGNNSFSNAKVSFNFSYFKCKEAKNIKKRRLTRKEGQMKIGKQILDENLK